MYFPDDFEHLDALAGLVSRRLQRRRELNPRAG
jgi:hypothetical protein